MILRKIFDIIKGRDKVMLDTMAYPYVVTLDGSLASDPMSYIAAHYGAAVTWRRAEPHPDGTHIFRLVGFREQEGGSATLWAYCLDGETKAPMIGTAMIRWWPDAPPVPEIPPPASAWYQTGIVAHVKETGASDWGVGRGEAYFPSESSGPCKVWAASLDGPSDIMEGWGWLDGTQYRQLCPVFERVLVGDDGGEEGGEDWSEVVKQLKRIADAAEFMAAHWPFK